jgi:hypothetical protein
MSTLIQCRVAAYVVVNSFFMRWCRQAQTLYWFIPSPKSLMIDPYRGVIVSVIASSVVDRGFEPGLGQNQRI